MHNFNINSLTVIVTKKKKTSQSLKKPGIQAIRSCDLDLNTFVLFPLALVTFLLRSSWVLVHNSDELNVTSFRILFDVQGDAEEQVS